MMLLTRFARRDAVTTLIPPRTTNSEEVKAIVTGLPPLTVGMVMENEFPTDSPTKGSWTAEPSRVAATSSSDPPGVFPVTVNSVKKA
jgi:hypothetical protein